MSTENKKVTPLIEIKNCVMEFPGVKALDQVKFTLMPCTCWGKWCGKVNSFQMYHR